VGSHDDIRNGEIHRVLRYLGPEEPCPTALAVSELTGADAREVALALGRVRSARRIRGLVIATLLVAGSMAAFKVLPQGMWPQEDQPSGSLAPARLP